MKQNPLCFPYLRCKSILMAGKSKAEKNYSGRINSSSVETPMLLLKWTPVIIFIFAFLLYNNTLKHGFVMDDGAVMTDNVTVQKGVAGIPELFQQSSVYGSTGDNYGSYRPLTMSFFAMEWQLFGNNSSRYHLVHVLLYALCCVMAFLMLKSLLSDFHPLLPVVSTLLFAAHPIHSEVAANIKSTDEILSLLFCSASLLFYLKYNYYSKYKYLSAGCLFFLAALFSKESAVTFLVIIPLALFLFTRCTVKNIVLLSSLNLAAVIILLAARSMVLEKTPEEIPMVNNLLVNASTVGEKFGTIFIFLFNYIRLLVFPHPLTWDYGYNHIPLSSFQNPFALFSLILYLFLGICALVLLLKHIQIRAPSTKTKLRNLLAFLALFYVGTLSVYSNVFFIMAATMAERFLFVPSLAFCIAVAIIFLKISRYDITNHQNGNSKILVILTVALLIPYSLKTWMRNKDWKSNYTLFATGVKTSPNSYRANATFAWENLLAGEKASDPQNRSEFFKTASSHYQKALSIYDKSPDDWFNFGVTSGYLEKKEEALKAYNQAVKMNDHSKSNYNLGAIYLKEEDYSKSLNHFLAAYNRDSSFR